MILRRIYGLELNNERELKTNQEMIQDLYGVGDYQWFFKIGKKMTSYIMELKREKANRTS